MGKSAPTPPPAPDPTVVANAQTASNDQTARLQALLNNVNYSGPYGTVSYNQETPGSDQYTQNVHLSAPEQSIFDQLTSGESGALGIANTQLNRVSSALGQGVSPTAGMATTPPSPSSYDSAPNFAEAQHNYDTGPQVQTSIGASPLTYSFSQGPQVQTGVGPSDFDQAVGQTVQSQYGAAMGLLDPQLQQQAQQTQAQLTAQGLNPNDAAWQNAMTLMGNQQAQERAQAANNAVQSGNAEQQALFGEALNQGQFANSAAGQIFGQNLGAAQFANAAQGQGFSQGQQQGQFANAAQGQIYGENQGDAAFYNSSAQQDFQNKMAQAQYGQNAGAQGFNQQLQAAQFQNQAQQQGFQQGAYAQELPINEFDALMSSGQVGMPQGVQYTPTTVAPTNVLGAYQLNQNGELANYQARLANSQSALGGLFSLGSSLLL